MKGAAWDFLEGLRPGPAAVSASERGSAWFAELLASGLIETFRAGPLAGTDAAGVTLLCARLTGAGRHKITVAAASRWGGY